MLIKFVSVSLISATATWQHLAFIVRDGDEVALPCKNPVDGQRNCDSTTWMFMNLRSAKTVTLFEHDQFHKEAGAKLGRLSVTANCSLVIQKVTDQDVGLYKCKRFISGNQQDSPVHLSVIHSEYLYISVVKLMCFVLSNILKYYKNIH